MTHLVFPIYKHNKKWCYGIKRWQASSFKLYCLFLFQIMCLLLPEWFKAMPTSGLVCQVFVRLGSLEHVFELEYSPLQGWAEGTVKGLLSFILEKSYSREFPCILLCQRQGFTTWNSSVSGDQGSSLVFPFHNVSLFPCTCLGLGTFKIKSFHPRGTFF